MSLKKLKFKDPTCLLKGSSKNPNKRTRMYIFEFLSNNWALYLANHCL